MPQAAEKPEIFIAESELGTFFFVVLFLHPLANDIGVGEISFQTSGSRIKSGMTIYRK